MPMAALRRAVEAVLVRSGGAALARRGIRGRTIVLAYHNIVPDELFPVGDRSLHLPLSHFRAQLDLLTRFFDVVPLTALLKPSTGRRPRAVLTFDDAYQGALTLGVAELAARGLQATVFVAPGLLGGRTFWWDEVAAARGDAMVPAELREEALWGWHGRGDAIRAGLTARGLTLVGASLPDAVRTATETELATAVQAGAVRLGAHSWSHPNLATVPAAELDEELVRPLAWLRRWFPEATDPWVAWPYGPDSLAVREAARRAGYAAALRITGRWLPPGAVASFETPRWNIPAGITPNGFTLRLADFPGL